MTETLLPISATSQERALAAAIARISDVPVAVRDVWNPDTCPVAALPWLASQFSVDTWKSEWTEAQKRQVISDSVFVHRHKGTIGAVRRALAAIGFTVRVQEWFNQVPQGDPFTYRLLLESDQVGYSQDQLGQLLDIIDGTKNLRSHLREIAPVVRSTDETSFGVVASVGSEVVVQYGMPDLSLMLEGVLNGMTETEAGVDALHTMLHATLTQESYF